MTSAPPPPTDPRFEKLCGGEPLEFGAPPKDREETHEEKTARTIPANWLECQIKDHRRIISKPVVISNAIIDGPLDLQHAVFGSNFSVTATEFSEIADFSSPPSSASPDSSDSLNFVARPISPPP